MSFLVLNENAIISPERAEGHPGRDRRCQAPMSASAAVITSPLVVVRPRDRRTEPSASPGSTPMAVMMEEADSSPAWHAEPVDAATSGAAARSAVPLTPGKRTL